MLDLLKWRVAPRVLWQGRRWRSSGVLWQDVLIVSISVVGATAAVIVVAIVAAIAVAAAVPSTIVYRLWTSLRRWHSCIGRLHSCCPGET